MELRGDLKEIEREKRKEQEDVDGIRRMLETTFRESKNRGLLYLCMGVCVHSEE